MNLTESELQRMAKRRVKQKMGFYIHASVYVLVNLGLAVLSWVGGRSWHLWPLAGWGIGLAIHGIYTVVSLRGDGLRQQMLAREVASLRQRQVR